MHFSRQSVFYSVASLILSNIILHILGFVYRIILSRLIGAQGMGVFQLVSPYYSILLSISLTGITMAVSRLCAERTALGDTQGAHRVIKASFILFALLFICVCIPTLLFSDTISRNILGDERTRMAMLIFLPCLMCTGIENILKNYFFGTRKMRPPIISELTEQIVRILAVAALLLYVKPTDAGSAAALIVCGMVISEVVSSTLLTIIYRSYARNIHTSRSAHEIGNILKIAVPVAISALINNLIISLNSILIPQRLQAFGISSDASIRIFGTLFGMTMPLLAFPIAFIAPLATVTVPKLSEGIAAKDLSDVKRKAGKSIHATSLLAFPAISVLIPLGSDICTLIYANTDAGRHILPLCVATLFSYYQITATSVLNAIGKQRYSAWITFLTGALSLIFTWCIGFWGISAFLIGNIFSAAVAAMLAIHSILRTLNLRLQLRNWFVSPMISAVLSGTCASFLHKMLVCEGFSMPLSICISLCASAIIYLVSLIAQGTRPINYLKTLIPKK